MPNCTDPDAVYKQIRQYYQGKKDKLSDESMRCSAELHVHSVKERKRQRLSLEELHRHATI